MSLRATGHASVRGTPAMAGVVAGAWALDELTAFRPAPRDPEQAPTMSIDERLAADAAAAAERARLIDEGYARGLAAGEAKAAAAAQEQLRQALAVVNHATGELHSAASAAPAILEENVAALAVIVARQIIARAVSVDREIVAELVRRAVTEFPIDQSVRIRVHPLDLSMLTGSAPTDAPITGSREASWVADARVVRGGCLVEGRERIIDGRVDTALERAYRRMVKIDAA